MTEPKVLLATLAIRTSAKGRPYLSGWLGKSRLVGFPGKRRQVRQRDLATCSCRPSRAAPTSGASS